MGNSFFSRERAGGQSNMTTSPHKDQVNHTWPSPFPRQYPASASSHTRATAVLLTRWWRQKIAVACRWCGADVLVRGDWPARWEPQEEGMMSVAASFPLVKKPRFIDQEKGDGDDWRCLWNLHTHKQILCSQLTMRLSISPVCLKQRLWVYRVENNSKMRVK
jgi:hypothetical protein